MSLTTYSSVSDLATQVAKNPTLAQDLKNDPAGTLAKIAAPLQSDVWIYRLVVGALGLVVLIAIIGAITLSVYGKTAIPDVITALGSASVGALAGLLAPSPASR